MTVTPIRTDSVDVERDADRTEQTVVQLDVRSVEAIVQRLAELIGGGAGRQQEPAVAGRLLSASEVAERWGVDRSWVYQHAERLGAIRLGDGPRPRLRFDPQLLARRLGGAPAIIGRPEAGNRRRSPQNQADPVPLLEIRGAPELSSADQTTSRPGGARTPPATAPK